MPFTAVAVYGLEVPAGDVLTPAAPDFPATFRITMAAIDPTEDPEPDEDGHVPPNPRSTLKLVRARVSDDADDDELDDEYMKQILAAASDDEDDSEDEGEETNGGPSDPAKSKKQKKAADLAKLIESLKDDDDSDEEMEDAKIPNGITHGKKGKQKASPKEDDDEDDEDDEDEESDDSDDGLEFEPFTICTLDTQSHYQQPLDITITEGEKVFFVVTGTHAVHLSGNYLIDEDEDDSDEEDEYDMDPEEADYLDEDISDDESDELDGLADPRIKELDTEEEDDEEDEEEEEVPKLVPVEKKKGKKRPAEDDVNGLDEMISKEAKTDEAKSSKQQKKLKNNKGEAVTVSEEAKGAKADKKVQFAKNLEQGPTGSPLNGKKETKAEKEKKPEAKQEAKAAADKPGLGVKVVQGVKVDDRKVGTGRTVKNGDTVGVRYIGKLADGKVFDANKKGKPFSFKVGKSQVIKGWDIGLLGMTIGGERRLTIPAHLAYGSKGMPGIPPNSALTFDIKLLEIK